MAVASGKTSGGMEVSTNMTLNIDASRIRELNTLLAIKEAKAIILKENTRNKC